MLPVAQLKVKILHSNLRIYITEPFQIYSSTVTGFLSELQMTGAGVISFFKKNQFSLRNHPVCLLSNLLNLGLKIDLLILFNPSCRSLLQCLFFSFTSHCLSSTEGKKGENENQMWLVKKHLQPFQFLCVLWGKKRRGYLHEKLDLKLIVLYPWVVLWLSG